MGRCRAHARAAHRLGGSACSVFLRGSLRWHGTTARSCTLALCTGPDTLPLIIVCSQHRRHSMALPPEAKQGLAIFATLLGSLALLAVVLTARERPAMPVGIAGAPSSWELSAAAVPPPPPLPAASPLTHHPPTPPPLPRSLAAHLPPGTQEAAPSAGGAGPEEARQAHAGRDAAGDRGTQGEGACRCCRWLGGPRGWLKPRVASPPSYCCHAFHPYRRSCGWRKNTSAAAAAACSQGCQRGSSGCGGDDGTCGVRTLPACTALHCAALRYSALR